MIGLLLRIDLTVRLITMFPLLLMSYILASISKGVATFARYVITGNKLANKHIVEIETGKEDE